jgi:hypothetical protein
MSIIDLYSKRQRRARGETPDVYIYDDLPNPLRVQIVHIIRDTFGVDGYSTDYVARAYLFVNETLCREYGLFQLSDSQRPGRESVINFFLKVQDAERALDVVEMCFRIIDGYIRRTDEYRFHSTRKMEPDDAIAELNDRFKEHGVGYQFESGEIIRVDSEFLHAEAVKPTLVVLRGEAFKGANEEFLQAHEHYRHGKHKECLVDCLKAFESTMKSICKLRNWPTQSTDTAKTLIATCFTNGVPTVRNKNGGHGQGPDPVKVPEYLARYALNLTATSILFLVEANETK